MFEYLTDKTIFLFWCKPTKPNMESRIDKYHMDMNLNRPNQDIEDNSDTDGKCVILDVGGDRFVASRKHLERFPSTR